MDSISAFVDLGTNNLLAAIPAGGDGVHALPASNITPEPMRHLGEIKRGDTLTFAVQFLSAGVITPVSAPATGTLEFKAKGNHNAAAAAGPASWVVNGSTYTFSITFESPAMNALFAIGDALPADEVSFVDLVGEIKWIDANGTHETTPDSALRVLNDVNQ
jgi:hypothetical protein